MVVYGDGLGGADNIAGPVGGHTGDDVGYDDNVCAVGYGGLTGVGSDVGDVGSVVDAAGYASDRWMRYIHFIIIAVFI